jgi:LacI family transcriptional regulator
MSRARTGIPHVAVLVPLSLKGHRDVFDGILRYVRLHGPWQLYRMEGRPGEQKLLDLKRWGCTGIITGPCTPSEATLIARARVPVVVFEPSPEMRRPACPLADRSCSLFDSLAVGKTAADYFLQRRYTHFAYVGDVYNLYWSRERQAGFCEAVKSSGAACSLYGTLSAKERLDWAAEQSRMGAWLQSLPKPVALFAAMDGRARQVLDACMAARIAVPDEVAVLGVDDDPFICEATFPTLSSIQTNGQQAGFLLAEHLDALMRGKRKRKQTIWVTPTRVVTRRSTDATAIPDRQIARALEFIWREAGHQPVHVPDVVRLIGSSRRFAEIHFKTAVGRTIMEEIRRVKLERVCALLAETNLTIGEITRQCGFTRESHLAFLFRKKRKQSMSAYRAASQRDLRSPTARTGCASVSWKRTRTQGETRSEEGGV